METKDDSRNYIDLRIIARQLWSRKRLFFKVWGITFVLACIWILPQPRYYEATVVLAPEAADQASGSTLGNLASSFGINIGGINSGDAIYPLLYPDVVASNDFVVGLLGIQVESIDGEIKTDYLDYLIHHQKQSPWSYPRIWLNQLKAKFTEDSQDTRLGTPGSIDPFRLSRKEEQIVDAVKDIVVCDVDRKTDVITITLTDQDPLICATMVDSVRARLQAFITSYRTSKARIDADYYTRLVDEAYQDYLQAQREYARYYDSHQNARQQTVLSHITALETEVDIKLNTYTAMKTNLEAAKAKVQESTPAFTVLQSATVPTMPSKPKRMVFVVMMLFLATMVTAGYIAYREVFKRIPSLDEAQEAEGTQEAEVAQQAGTAENAQEAVEA